MKRGTSFLAGMLSVLLLGSASAWCLPLNITISDRSYAGSGWYGNHEDQEVEPGTVAGQQWDLEAFLQEGNRLTMVGGYDFAKGQDGIRSGDLFIDVTGNVGYGVDTYNATAADGTFTANNLWGYDYVFDMDFSTLTYDVYWINSRAMLLTTVYYRANDESNPWRYGSGGLRLGSGAITYRDLGSADVYGLTGGRHYAATVDVGFLGRFFPAGTIFTSHFTMECGNDNLMGRGATAVPEPSTFLLVGAGLLGLGVVRRRKSRR